jgi:hypothetical protein
MHTKFLLENVKGRDLLEDLGFDGRVILERILQNECEKVWAGF